MDEIEEISIGCETEDGILVRVEGIEVQEYEEYDDMRMRCSETTCLSPEELRRLIQEAEMVLERDELSVNGKTKISEVERGEGVVTELFIEPHEFPDGLELSKTASVLTDSYELGTIFRGSTLIKENTTYSIDEVEGSAFRLVSNGVVDIGFACRLTDWEYDDEGNVDNINVPDVPYDEGHFDLEPGDYRVWEETRQKEG